MGVIFSNKYVSGWIFLEKEQPFSGLTPKTKYNRVNKCIGSLTVIVMTY